MDKPVAEREDTKYTRTAERRESTTGDEESKTCREPGAQGTGT